MNNYLDCFVSGNSDVEDTSDLWSVCHLGDNNGAVSVAADHPAVVHKVERL